MQISGAIPNFFLNTYLYKAIDYLSHILPTPELIVMRLVNSDKLEDPEIIAKAISISWEIGKPVPYHQDAIDGWTALKDIVCATPPNFDAIADFIKEVSHEDGILLSSLENTEVKYAVLYLVAHILLSLIKGEVVFGGSSRGFFYTDNFHKPEKGVALTQLKQFVALIENRFNRTIEKYEMAKGFTPYGFLENLVILTHPERHFPKSGYLLFKNYYPNLTDKTKFYDGNYRLLVEKLVWLTTTFGRTKESSAIIDNGAFTSRMRIDFMIELLDDRVVQEKLTVLIKTLLGDYNYNHDVVAKDYITILRSLEIKNAA